MRFSKEDYTILYLLCGSGITLIVSAKLHRKGEGVEINPKISEIARQNLKPRNEIFLNSNTIELLSHQKVIVGD